MSFIKYLAIQAEMHGSIETQDIIKLCYQAAFGAEHLIQDKQRARSYLQEEFDSLDADSDTTLYETLNEDICRVNLKAWKHKNLPIDWLFEMFCGSIPQNGKGTERFLSYIEDAKILVNDNKFNISTDTFNSFYNEYLKDGIRAVHHSDGYRAQEKPAYRIVHTKYLRIITILERIAEIFFSGKANCIIAIDGRCGSGKTTTANLLAEALKIDVIHADDFFLPPIKRTEQRLCEIGGNIDYERFLKEVIPNLSHNKSFSYNIFDCSSAELNKTRQIGGSNIRLIEGAYSHHPYFKDYADIKIFSDITAEEQMRRIIKRNGLDMAKRFKEEWIPMEERYFKGLEIEDRADLILK